MRQIDNGISVLPVGENKRPTIEWKELQSRIMTKAEAVAAFNNGQRLGLVCGAVSGNLEVIDFDDPSLYPKWRAFAAGFVSAEVLDALVVSSTPSGGFHVIYRHTAPPDGNKKLAMKSKTEVGIETRGEGGYVVAFPSKGYRVIQGKLNKIPVIDSQTRTTFFAIAESFDCVPEPEPEMRTWTDNRDAPGSKFNSRASWHEILSPHGWKPVCKHGGREYWKRPGDTDSLWSATTGNGLSGQDLLYVFSTSTQFTAQKTYSKFAAKAVLEYGGDFAACARELVKAEGIPLAPSPIIEAGKNGRIKLSEVEALEVSWLWEPYIPLGAVTILDADMDVGKSIFALAIAAGISRGYLPGLPEFPPCRTLILAAEDDADFTVVPRLQEMEANLSYIEQVQDETFPAFIKGGFDVLEKHIKDFRPHLVVIDMLNHFSGGVNVNNDNEAKPMMYRLRLIAKTYGCAILALRHVTKGKDSPDGKYQRDDKHKGTGSIGLGGSARSGLIIEWDGSTSGRRIVRHYKHNWSDRGASIYFRSSKRDGFRWEGFAPDAEHSPSSVEEASDFLRELLKWGPVLVSDIQASAKTEGHSWSAVRRAKEALFVRAKKRSGDGFSEWSLPETGVTI